MGNRRAKCNYNTGAKLCTRVATDDCTSGDPSVEAYYFVAYESISAIGVFAILHGRRAPLSEIACPKGSRSDYMTYEIAFPKLISRDLTAIIN